MTATSYAATEPVLQNLYTNLDQIGDINEVRLWWKNTRDWDSTARRAFEAAWTVYSIASADQAHKAASNAVTGAISRLHLLTRTAAPYDDLLRGPALHDVMQARKANMQERIQDKLATELHEAETSLAAYCDACSDLQDKVDGSLLRRYLDADETTRNHIMDVQWDVAFAAGPNSGDPVQVPVASEELDTIAVLVQLPFFAELSVLRPLLEKTVLALGGEMLEKDGGGVGDMDVERMGTIKQRAADAAVAAARKINMLLAERAKDKKEDTGDGGKPATYALK